MPRSKHATLLAIATGALALYTLLAVAVYSHIAARERMDVRQSVDNMGWAGSHFQTEFYKFEQRLSAFAAEVPGVDSAEVQLRFDILMGRLETLRSGAQREVYGDNAELAQTYELIRGKIAGLESVMTSVGDGDRLQIPAVLAVLQDLEAPVAKLANGISRFAIAERARLGASILRASNWLGVLLIGQIITLLLLGSFLWRQFSELQRSQASLEASNKALVASQADVRRNEYRFRQFFNNVRDIVVCMGTKGQSDFGYDTGGVLLLGRDVDRIAGTRRATTGLAEIGKWYDAVHPEDRANYKEAERRRKENGEAYSLTYRFTHPETGELRWAAETGWSTNDPVGDAVFYDSYILDVTEHKKLETQLRENQSILQSVVDNSPIAINVKDRDGRYVLINEHVANMFGTTPAAAVGRFADDVHGHGYHNPHHHESHLQVVESGAPILDNEDIFAGVTGNETWITNKAPVKDAAGEVRYVVTVSMPVPQLAKANKALAESRAMLLEAERQAKIVSWNQPLNSDAGTVWSENVTEILGLPPELVSNDASFLSYVHAEDRDRVRAEFARTTENPGAYEIDYRFVRPDGRTIWLRTTAKVHLDKERPGSRLIGTNQDITAQKSIELALRESKLHLHAAQRRARMAYWTWDIAAGESYVWSDEAADILGLPPGAVPRLDKDFLNLIHPDDRARIAREYDHTLAHYNEFEFSYRLIRPDGRTIWIRELAEPIMGADGCPAQMIGTIQDVTSQKQVEEALRESEARLRGFMDHAPMLISLKDPQERYQLVNRELVDFLGVAEDTIVGRTVFDVFPRHIAERLSEDDRSVLADGKVISREFSETETYSRYSEVSVTKFPIRDAEGRIIGVGGITLDISDRKRAEQALRESEARLRGFMHNAPVGMIIKSMDSRFLMANPFVARAYNKPEAAFLGHRTSDLAKSEGARDIESLERTVIETGKATSKEVFFPDHTASPWTHQVRFPIFDEFGVMTSIGGFAIDITERKNAEMARRESESLFRSFLENSPAGMAVKDRDGRFLLVNRYVEAEFGLPATDILGRRSAEIASTEEAAVAESMDREVLESGEAVEREIHLPARSDFEWTYTVKFPIKDANGRITAVGGFGFDIGERKQMERALRESEARLRDAQRRAKLTYWYWFKATGDYEWSSEAAALLGCAPDRLPTNQDEYLMIVHADDRDRLRELYDRHVDGPTSYEVDYRIVRSDGSVHWIRELAATEANDRGEVLRGVGTLQDITEQKLVEEALRRNQRRLLRAQGQARIADWEWDIDADICTWSESAAAVLQVPEDRLQRRLDEFFSDLPTEERSGVLRNFRSAAEHGVGYDIEYRVARDGGKTLWLREIAEVERDAGGRPVKMVGTIQDITDRKRNEDALRDSQARLKKAQRVARIGSWDWTPGSENLRWSEEALEIFGYADGKTLRPKREWQERIHPDDQPSVSAKLAAFRAAGQKLEMTYRIVLSDQSIRVIREDIERTIGPVDGAYSESGTVQDVTEWDRTQRALRQSESRMRAFMDHAPMMIYLKDAEGRYQIVNREFKQVEGVTEDQVRGKTVFDLLPRQDAELLDAADREVMAHDRVISREMHDAGRAAYRDGFAVKFPVRDGDGNIVGVGGITQDITERKQAENALREGESRLRRAQLQARLASWSWDLNTNIWAWAPGSGPALGMADADLPSKDAGQNDFVHPDDRAMLRRIDAEIEAGRDSYTAEFRCLRPDGTVFWAEEIGEVERDTDGRRVAVSGTLQDISDRKRGEQALRESEARLRSFMDHAPFVAYLKDREGRYVLVNREFQRVENRPESDFIGKTAYDLVPREEADAWTESDRAVLAEGGIVTREFSQSRLGNYTHTLNVKFPVRDSDGRIIGIAGYAQDITERKRVELALRESESRLRRAQQQVRLAYWSWQIETEEYQWAPGAGLILGVADRDLPYTEAGYLELIHPDDRERMKRLYDEFARSGSEFNHDFRIQRPDGAIVWMREIAQIERDAAGRRVAVSGTIQDITEQHNLEEQLRQSQKMEAIGQLTGGIAHDFNNLLAVVLGNLELVTEQIGDNKKLAKGIDNAIRASLRGADLTQRLLAFARRQVLAPVATDVNALIADMRDLLIRPLGPTIEFSSVFANEVWPIEIDQSQLEAALLNMALNARDAMPEGGRLTIKTSNAHVSAAVSDPGGELQPGDYVLISVADTGGGMSDEVKSRAFDPFYTTKSLGKGTGLGLSMVYGFVKQSGGHIAIDSEIGVGTTMMIYLPRAGDGGAATSAKAEAAVPRAHGETILVLEDEAEVAMVAQRYLANLGYKVIVTADAESAMAKLASAPRVDLLLADVILGGKLDGRAVAKQAVARWPNLNVLFMSGYAPNGDSRDADGEPSAIQIAKPFRKADLAREVRRALDRESRNHQGKNR